MAKGKTTSRTVVYWDYTLELNHAEFTCLKYIVDREIAGLKANDSHPSDELVELACLFDDLED